jgi:hypothetical protein
MGISRIRPHLNDATSPERTLRFMKLTETPIAAAMGVSVSFMKRKVRSGEVASFKWGRMRLIPIEGLRALMVRATQPD